VLVLELDKYNCPESETRRYSDLVGTGKTSHLHDLVMVPRFVMVGEVLLNIRNDHVAKPTASRHDPQKPLNRRRPCVKAGHMGNDVFF
jgi:hypothetical protein